MSGKLLISTAYLPPVEYFSKISQAEEIYFEKEENYLKQSYRNRCYILSSQGPLLLTVPVYLGSVHKTPIKDIRIDYSKRWQQVHLRALVASYSASSYFEYYFEIFEKVISDNNTFLIDLNMMLTESILDCIKMKKKLLWTTEFEVIADEEYDFRYKITPKKMSNYNARRYTQVFSNMDDFKPGLSIIDLLFNEGPESVNYL
jgi:hypothetical protein